jgi:hypothetical protein
MANVKPGTSFVASRSQKKRSSKSPTGRSRSAWWEKETKKRKGMMMCGNCAAVYFDGHWHTIPAMASTLKGGRKPVDAAICYECHCAAGIIDRKEGFEGILTLDGLEDAAEKAEILATARNFGKRATKRDPNDRVINIDDRGARVIITTTENQMAVGMGKAVDASHKGGKLRISWSDDDLPVRVYWKRKT